MILCSMHCTYFLNHTPIFGISSYILKVECQCRTVHTEPVFSHQINIFAIWMLRSFNVNAEGSLEFTLHLCDHGERSESDVVQCEIKGICRCFKSLHQESRAKADMTLAFHNNVFGFISSWHVKHS